MRLTNSQLARALNERGFPLAESTVRLWNPRHPGLTVQVGGRHFWREEVIPLLLAGTPLAEIETRMKALR